MVMCLKKRVLKSKVRKESDPGRNRRDARLRAGDSGNQPGRSRGNGLRAKRPWVNHEGRFIGATGDAAKKLLGIGRKF